MLQTNHVHAHGVSVHRLQRAELRPLNVGAQTVDIRQPPAGEERGEPPELHPPPRGVPHVRLPQVLVGRHDAAEPRCLDKADGFGMVGHAYGDERAETQLNEAAVVSRRRLDAQAVPPEAPLKDVPCGGGAGQREKAGGWSAGGGRGHEQPPREAAVARMEHLGGVSYVPTSAPRARSAPPQAHTHARKRAAGAPPPPLPTVLLMCTAPLAARSTKTPGRSRCPKCAV